MAGISRSQALTFVVQFRRLAAFGSVALITAATMDLSLIMENYAAAKHRRGTFKADYL
ncbi:hypothetical protein AAII07_23970 [Microvirga sp. 0TCS3.31]